MSNDWKKLSTLGVNCLSSFLLLGVIGCATHGRKKADLELEVKARVLRLETELSKKDAIIGRLEAKLNAKPAKVPKATFHPAPKTQKTNTVKTEKLKPEMDGAEEENLDALVGEGEESVSDSSQEILHFYYLGYQQLSEKKFDNAIRSLEHFLEENPAHVYADRAQYLIAEANCSAKEFHLCLLAANTLETRYPYSLRLPDAISLKVQALRQMGQQEEAAKTLARLNKIYPDYPVSSHLLNNTRVKSPPPLLEDTDE